MINKNIVTIYILNTFYEFKNVTIKFIIKLNTFYEFKNY